MADIPVDPFTWSTNPSANQPDGTDTVGTGLKDNLRAMQASIKMALTNLTSVAGTNTITATATGLTAYALGQKFRFIPAATNTGATTLNITSLGAQSIFWNGAACVGGELRSGIPVEVTYDGTQFNILGNGFNAPFLDTHPIVQGSSDSTKKVRLEVDGFTSATTRVITPPDRNLTLNDNSPSFSAYVGTATSMTQNTFTKMGFDTEDWDDNTNYDAATNFRFTPTVAGVYLVQITATLSAINDTKSFLVSVHKNGSLYKQGGANINGSGGVVEATADVSCLVSMNGSTDYIEAFGFNTDTAQNLITTQAKNHFSAFRVTA